MGPRPLGLPWQKSNLSLQKQWPSRSQPGRRGTGWILSMCELSVGEPFLIEGKGRETTGSVSREGPDEQENLL